MIEKKCQFLYERIRIGLKSMKHTNYDVENTKKHSNNRDSFKKANALKTEGKKSVFTIANFQKNNALYELCSN